MKGDGYQYVLKRVAAATLTVAMLGATVGGVLAADGGYGDGKKVGDGNFASSTYNVTVDDTLYQYATGDDGTAYYTTFDGSEWTEWTEYGEQPVKYKADPAPVSYNDASYVTYYGEDGKYYFAGGNGEWTDISGDYTFKYAPYANVYNDKLYIYGVADDGYVYWIDYNGSEWGTWGEIGGQTTGAYEVYAVDWNDYNNVFWTSEDGKVYWNRWDGTEWTGVRDLPNGTAVSSAPYAAGYAPEEKLYAYAVTGEGQPAWTSFTEGEGWADWATYDGLDTKVKNQPNVYVYDDVQHIVYTGENGNGYYTQYDGEWAAEWTDLGDNYAWDPYQYEYDGDLYLTYTGENGSVYNKAWAGGEDDSSY